MNHARRAIDTLPSIIASDVGTRPYRSGNIQDGVRLCHIEVIESRAQWLRQNVFIFLRDSRPPETRIREMLRFVDVHYEGGTSVCLLGVLALSHNSRQYRERLSAVFTEWIDALAVPLIDAGMQKANAMQLAQMSIMRIQGSLLMTKALGSERPFVQAVKIIRADLLDALKKSRWAHARKVAAP